MKYVPPLGADDENASYIDGNPEFGIEGSPVPAASIEHPQREIVEVITQAGLTPSGGDVTQLWQALLEVIRVKVPLATLARPGIVQPDGIGCTVDAAGLLSLLPDMRWLPTVKYEKPVLCVGPDNKLYLWLAPSGPGVAGVGAKVPGAAGSEVFWLDYAASIAPPQNALLTLLIGTPIPVPSTSLPATCMWADGSLALFDDWPQVAAKYQTGGFAGMTLPHTATQAEKDVYRAKWVLNADTSGLYLPRLSGLVRRDWISGAASAAGAATPSMGAWGPPVTSQATTISKFPYTAPEPGYVIIHDIRTGANNDLYAKVDGVLYNAFSSGHDPSDWIAYHIPVAQGSVVRLYAGVSGGTELTTTYQPSRFIPVSRMNTVDAPVAIYMGNAKG